MLLEQDYPNLEVILSDDGSDNFSYDLVEDYVIKAKEKNINLIINHNEKNVGTVKNINGALKLAQGDIIGFLGCGDYYSSSHIIKEMVGLFEKYDVEVVAAKMKGMAVSDSNKVTILPEKRFCKLLSEMDNQKLLNQMINANCFCAPATFYKKEVYQKYGMYDERMRLIEDYPFMFKLVLNNAKIKFWDKCVTMYTFDGVSSGKASPLILADLEKIQRLVLLPNIGRCALRQRRLFLYNYYRKRSKKLGDKVINILKYPEQFLYWQYVRVIGIIQRQRRK
jgi:cellulose synthase/poly-beta-1,6-N-acetylglucosamine synthase-like glycosyltransferase